MPVKTSPEATVGSDGKKLPYLNKDQSTVKHRHRKTRYFDLRMNQATLPLYEPNHDKFLASFFRKPTVQKQLSNIMHKKKYLLISASENVTHYFTNTDLYPPISVQRPKQRLYRKNCTYALMENKYSDYFNRKWRNHIQKKHHLVNPLPQNTVVVKPISQEEFTSYIKLMKDRLKTMTELSYK